MWADVKSERYKVSDSVPKSVKLEKAFNDVVKGQEDSERVGPWWEEFPKRWVIVVLCFSAFLLCNMDRVSFPMNVYLFTYLFSWAVISSVEEGIEQYSIVWQVNMSIAILPMSSEFNWNPATVGLIQSSFFWGYLLTQV